MAWVDIDADEAPDIDGLDTFDVDSGTAGHVHRYTVLDEPVRDPSNLNKAMTIAYEGD